MATSDRLRALRKQHKLGQADVAAGVSVSVPTISEWESGKKKPSRDKVMKLARFYGVSSSWILEEAGLAMPERAQDDQERAILRAFREAPAHLRRAAIAVLAPEKEKPN